MDRVLKFEKVNPSDLKLQVQKVIFNIRALEQLKDDMGETSSIELQDKISETNALLLELEKVPATTICHAIQKRKNKRSKRKEIILKRKSSAPIVKIVPAKVTSSTEIVSTPKPENITNKPKVQKPHNQLRSYYEARQFLRKLDLLEKLHITRAQNFEEARRLDAYFHRLRLIWNSILVKNTPKCTEQPKLEDQWNEVFFGTSEEVYYRSERKMKNFIDNRHIWDSYLTRSNKHGSSIPLGWVLPLETPDERWSQYRVE